MRETIKIGDYDISRESLKGRILRYLADSNSSMIELAERSGIHQINLYRLNHNNSTGFSSIERIAYSHDLLPVVLYNEEDHHVEDLGMTGFLSGEKVENYIGRVFRRIRRLKELGQKEIAELSQISAGYLCQIENGKRKTVGTGKIDRISIALSLIPFWLVPKSKFVERERPDLVGIVEEQLVRNPNVSLENLKRLIERLDSLCYDLETIYEIFSEEENLDEN
mgnify:CR=1 FL=1